MTFAEWFAEQRPELDAIERVLRCDDVEALTLLLLMRVSGDLREVEEWESPE